MSEAKKTGVGKIALEAVWYNNPIFRQILGICSTLAVTNLVLNTLVMCAALTAVTGLSSLTVSLLREWTPRNIRMMVETLIMAFYVILVDVALAAYWPEMRKNLGPFVGLIITNCILMGRAEAFAITNPPWPSLVDGVMSGLGYSMILVIIAVVRELFGMGTICGVAVPYFSSEYWDKWIIMVMPPGAFFMLALVIWAFRSYAPEAGGESRK
ncbi:MAG: NADH:ubiquinone reductase (Na(+)-transporting) subunit D [bacterium]|nr:NADH:ubiquinone reductase (Na(+)-transporting) subunit D [bacterium]